MAVAGHALDCAESAGMRRLHWTAPNAPTAWECAGNHRLRRIAPFAPNCADCAVCAELRRLRWNCAGILPTAWHTANTTLWLSQPGCDLGFAACSFRQCLSCQVFVAHCWQQFPQSCDFSSTFSQRNKPMPVKNLMCCCLPLSFFFRLQTTNLASINVLLCAQPELCAHFGTVLGLLFIHISHMSYAHRFDRSNSILFFVLALA